MLFITSTLVYLAVVLYAPATALSGVSQFETWVFVVTVGCVCTFYTAIGGLKAVVWTDAFQVHNNNSKEKITRINVIRIANVISMCNLRR